jgi:hypothetical protein
MVTLQSSAYFEFRTEDNSVASICEVILNIEEQFFDKLSAHLHAEVGTMPHGQSYISKYLHVLFVSQAFSIRYCSSATNGLKWQELNILDDPTKESPSD